MREAREKRTGRAGRLRRNRGGMTLVELIVSLALMSLVMALVMGVVSPAARTFARQQRVQFAQLILDNVEDEIKGQLLEATDSVKIYSEADGGTIVGASGSDNGPVLEYVNPDSYVVLMSADGCDETTLVRSGKPTGTEKAAKGRLLMRYYWQEVIGSEKDVYGYRYKDDGKLVSRAVQQVFTDKYYMGNYLKINFAFPDGVDNTGDEVSYLEIHVELYRDPERTDLLAKEDFVADLRYKAKREDQATASAK